MLIQNSQQYVHWNYFLTLESDLINLSRYIEFSRDNDSVYSTELTRILITAASEVDVVIKMLCNFIDNTQEYRNINQYRNKIITELPEFPCERVYINRYGISFNPWEKWQQFSETINPDWWKAYNKLKHERDSNYNKANLKNTLNAVGALLITCFYYYKKKFEHENNRTLSNIDIIGKLYQSQNFITLDDNYYYDVLTMRG